MQINNESISSDDLPKSASLLSSTKESDDGRLIRMIPDKLSISAINYPEKASYLSTKGGALNMISVIIGGGIVGLPYAVLHAGLPLSMFLLLIMA